MDNNNPVRITPEQLERLRANIAAHANEHVFEILPGVQIVINLDKFNLESNFSLGDFSEGADIKVYLDVRLVDVITKEQSKAESLVILRTK